MCIHLHAEKYKVFCVLVGFPREMWLIREGFISGAMITNEAVRLRFWTWASFGLATCRQARSGCLCMVPRKSDGSSIMIYHYPLVMCYIANWNMAHRNS